MHLCLSAKMHFIQVIGRVRLSDVMQAVMQLCAVKSHHRCG